MIPGGNNVASLFFLKLRTDNHVTGKRKRQIQEQILELQLKKKKKLTKKINMVFLMTWASDNYS